MKLSILIPTFNRCQELNKNIQMLCKFIRDMDACDSISLLISDNQSTDSTKVIIEELKLQNKDIHIRYHVNPVNIGIGRNFLKVVELAESEYGMLLGDDDYIAYEYLEKVMQLIKEDNIRSIIPSYYNIFPDGKKMGRGRDLDKRSKRYEKGFKSCFLHSWRAHQMSGLVFKLEQVQRECVERNISNSYMQIYVIAKSCMLGNVYHLTDFPVKVTRPTQAHKAWSYGMDGLVGEVFENYKYLAEVEGFRRSILEIRFLQAQYWRVAMYLKMGIVDFLRCMFHIQCSKNISRFTALFLPIIIPTIFVQKGIALAISGKLIETLKTKVDVK